MRKSIFKMLKIGLCLKMIAYSISLRFICDSFDGKGF